MNFIRASGEIAGNIPHKNSYKCQRIKYRSCIRQSGIGERQDVVEGFVRDVIEAAI